MPSHPSGEVLDATLASIRERLPTSEIIIMFDGVSSTLMHLKANYEDYTQSMLARINEMDNVTPLVFSEHMHQSLMLKKALELVRTPLILWSEQDTPLHNDIPFDKLTEPILTGYANVIRFHHEASIHPEHKYLMLDDKPIEILGQPFIRTRQWSGRPALISTKFFKYMADKYLDDQPRFIEHVFYGIVVEGNFDEFRLHIYAPPSTLVRSKHLDGRRYGADHYDESAS
jgi:hypothetical protein